MTRIPIKTRLAALFILTFLCLNAGGAVCLAYCQGASAAQTPSAEHCPLKKQAPDCHHASQRTQDAASLETETVTCCSLAINVFIAPIERKQIDQGSALLVEQAITVATPKFLRAVSFDRQPFNFVGPQLDRRVERLKHRVFRI